MVEWFGFKLHLMVDVKHEVVLSYEVTDTKAGDGETLPSILAQAQANLPEDRIKTLAYDKAADSEDVHKRLSDEGITPLIQMRSMWQTEPERMLPGHDGRSNVVYTEDGTIYCYDKVSEPPVRHKMAYIGHEPERRDAEVPLPGETRRLGVPDVVDLQRGEIVRQDGASRPRDRPATVPGVAACDEEVRADVQGPDVGGASQRTAEGVLGRRRRQSDGVAPVRGAEVGVVLAVHAAFATLLASAPRREGTLCKLRLGPIAEALRATGQGGPTRAGSGGLNESDWRRDEASRDRGARREARTTARPAQGTRVRSRAAGRWPPPSRALKRMHAPAANDNATDSPARLDT